MKGKKIITSILLTSLLTPYAKAAEITQKTTGNCSPAVVAKGNVAINCGLSKEEVEKIVAVYAKKHHLSDEQVAALSIAIFALGKGIGVLGTKAEINEAIIELKEGNIEKAKKVFSKEAGEFDEPAQQQKVSNPRVFFSLKNFNIKDAIAKNKQQATAYRNLGALVSLEDNYEAMRIYLMSTALDKNNIDGWTQLGHLAKKEYKVGEKHQFTLAVRAYKKVLKLAEIHQNKKEISYAQYNLKMYLAIS